MTLPKCKKCGCINLRRKINPSGGTRKTICYQCNTIVFYANRNPIIGEDRLFSIPPELLWPYRGAIEWNIVTIAVPPDSTAKDTKMFVTNVSQHTSVTKYSMMTSTSVVPMMTMYTVHQKQCTSSPVTRYAVPFLRVHHPEHSLPPIFTATQFRGQYHIYHEQWSVL